MADTMKGLSRTHYCGEINNSLLGKEETVCGWVSKQRDLGTLIFADIRDRSGIVQLAFSDETDKTVFEKAASLRGEFVICAKGTVRERESKNPDLPNGDVELFVNDLRILNKAETPPFEIVDNTNVKEELRLKYRYLDLRRNEMQKSLMMRHKIVKAAREYFDSQGFMEIETPVLVKSTPEGARDYLVPSRVQNGKFYALPQSPQLYKQLLMLSGCDRYMQIAKCFRDEDLRADRQPEFTQIDLEMSFVDQEDVMAVNEGFIQYVFKNVLGIDIPLPLPRMPYDEAMSRYGSDKPDIRFEMELVDLSETVANCGFGVFDGALSSGGKVMAVNAKGAADSLSRKEIDKLTDFVKTYKAKGLAFSKYGETISSSFEKFLSEETISAIHKKTEFSAGDVLFVVADSKADIVMNALGNLRCELAKRLGLIKKGDYKLLWVTDFPLFEYDEEEDRFVAKHHPFTMPKEESIPLLSTDPGKAYAKAYDIILNGCELGGGSQRINDPEIQNKMFEAIGFTPEEAYERFGFLLDAFKYGAPPHAGLAFGLDRLVMLLLEKDSIRDVIAFPKVQNASELMTMCPSEVEEKQLKELGITVEE